MVDLCIISFNLYCIMQFKQLYNIVTKVSSRKKVLLLWWSTWLITGRPMMGRYNLSFEQLSLFSMVADLFSLYILLLFAKYFQMVKQFNDGWFVHNITTAFEMSIEWGVSFLPTLGLVLHICITETGFNTLRARQNGRHFPEDIFKWIFLNENVWISIHISLFQVSS